MVDPAVIGHIQWHGRGVVVVVEVVVEDGPGVVVGHLVVVVDVVVVAVPQPLVVKSHLPVDEFHVKVHVPVHFVVFGFGVVVVVVDRWL